MTCVKCPVHSVVSSTFWECSLEFLFFVSRVVVYHANTIVTVRYDYNI